MYFSLSHLLGLLFLDGVQEHLQLEPCAEHVIEKLVEDHGVDPGEESADVEEAGGGHHGLVLLQDGAKDAAKVQASVVGVADALNEGHGLNELGAFKQGYKKLTYH